MPEQPADAVLQGLGLTLGLDDGDLVANAVVIAKVIDGDGDVGVVLSHSEGTSWLDQLALVTAASEIIRSTGFDKQDD
ncbi:hypothetical protein [Spirillospora sp. NBC_01491]|uniref:hypothetical protein n=1 Tax=Spirillospora sp. NBC_01491 TaxID=2976007 RepID=UPI002E337B40|nr:hypothetical protein [Spirillospora sp. NBC_01491]